MQRNFKWGILGLGKIAGKMAHDLALVPNAQLYAVASQSIEKAQAFADEHKAEKTYNRYTDLCSDPNVDIVYIATPHSFHYEHASLAIEAGKAVLVEKPMGLSAEQTEALIAKAKQHQVFLMEGLWTRFIPITERYLELLGSKELGEVKRLQADFGFTPPYDPENRLFNQELGGGALLDIGIYPLYLALITLGQAPSMEVRFRKAPTGVDVHNEVLLKYPNATADLLSSFEEQSQTEALIETEKASIKIHSRFHHSAQMSINTRAGSEEIHLPFKGLGYVHEIEEVHACLSQGLMESPKHPHQMTLLLAKELARIKKEMDRI